METEFEKAKSRHEELLAERNDKNVKASMEQMIDELQQQLNELKKLVMSEEPQQDGELKGYYMDVLTEAPEYGKLFWYVGSDGTIECTYYHEDCHGIEIFNWSPTFANKESAETYKEFMTDAERLSRPFVADEDNFSFVYNHKTKHVDWYQDDYYEAGTVHFNRDDINFLLEKYGAEVIKNWILYCK